MIQYDKTGTHRSRVPAARGPVTATLVYIYIIIITYRRRQVKEKVSRFFHFLEAKSAERKLPPWYSHPCGDYLESIHYVVILSGVTSIGQTAFDNCVNLEQVSIPEGVTRLGDACVVWCGDLTEIILP